MTDPLRDTVARNVRAERHRRRWTQHTLAAAMGTTPSTISALEAGHRRIDIDDLLTLCQTLQLPLARLLIGIPTDHLRTLGLQL